MSRMPPSSDGEAPKESELDSIEIAFDLSATTEVNSDGTPRQEIIRECDDKPLIFLDPRARGIRVFVRRKRYFDRGHMFGLVGEFPCDVMDRYAPYFNAGWQFSRLDLKVIRNGPTLGLRLCGRLVPPKPKPSDDNDESRWDLT